MRVGEGMRTFEAMKNEDVVECQKCRLEQNENFMIERLCSIIEDLA